MHPWVSPSLCRGWCCPRSWVRLRLALTLLLFIPILSEEGRKLLLFPPSRSVSRLGIQDAPRFAGGRWGKGCKTWLRSGDYLWQGLVPCLIPFAASFPPPTAPCCSWAGGGGRGKCHWQFPRSLILPCSAAGGGDERVGSLRGVMLPGGTGSERPSRRISPCPARAAQETGCWCQCPCAGSLRGDADPGDPPTPPAVAAEGAWADGMNERCFRRCSRQVLTSVA